MGLPFVSALFAGDDGESETALCKDGKFLILKGDFRAEYSKAVPKGYDAALQVYEAHKDQARSSWSEDKADVPT